MPTGVYNHCHLKGNKFGKANKGHSVSKKIRDKIKKSLIGHKPSLRARKKHSKAIKGENHWN